MSKVNFVREQNMMMRFARDNDLTANERMLWIALLTIANERAEYDAETSTYEWPDGFMTLSNALLTDYSGLEKKAIERAREGLKELGVIDFEPGFKRRNKPTYKLFYISTERAGMRDDASKKAEEAARENAQAKSTIGDHLETEKAQDVSKASPKCPQNVSKMSPKRPQNDPLYTSSFYRNSNNIKYNTKSNGKYTTKVCIEQDARARAREQPWEKGEWNGPGFIDPNETIDENCGFVDLKTLTDADYLFYPGLI